MQKIKYFGLILLVFVSGIYIGIEVQNKKENGETTSKIFGELPYSETPMGNQLFLTRLGELSKNIDLLHMIKINKIDKITSRLEKEISDQALTINELITEPIFKEDAKSTAFGTIRLISVMNEKFNIPMWKNNTKLLKLFNDAQKENVNNTKWFRCQDWSKPMWIGKKCNQ